MFDLQQLMSKLPYPAHPFCAMFPPMTEAEFANLMEDIRRHGMREPIMGFESQIIDGRHRALACIAAEVEPRFEIWDRRGSLGKFVVSKNLCRRHMSYDQQVGLALSKADVGRREDPTGRTRLHA